MKILLVEGSDAHLARSALQASDPALRVDPVGDADAALRAVAREPWDVIVFDGSLPTVGGLGLLRTLRERGVDAPVVMITDPDHVRGAVESGATDCVVNSEGHVDLLPVVVRGAYQRWRAERENQDLRRQVLLGEERLEALARRLAEYELKAVEAQKGSAILTVVRGICHEINNPLTGILGYAQLLQETVTGPGVEDIREIEACAQRCRAIVAGLARFCRYERAQVAPVGLNDVLKDSLAFVEYHALRHQIRVVPDFSVDLPRIVGNAQDLRLAFLAVVMNGIQAMPAGGTLTVGSRLDGGDIQVVVSDTGVGIPGEDLDRIFSPFFTTREAGRGSGLGLALACSVATAHGGELTVESAVGQGSTFTFVLPVRSAADRISPPGEPPPGT